MSTVTATRDARRLTRRFYRRDSVTLAKALLGQMLVRTLDDGSHLAGRIVETEAYLGVPDLAAHSANGRRTARNASMYGDGGTAYVYFTYGMHYCFNVVADRSETPTACLVRALEPVEGLDMMRQLRSGKVPADRLRDVDLCSGPAKLCQALAIDRTLDGEDLTLSDRLFLRRGRSVPAERIITAPRVGVAYAGPWAAKPLRFLVRGNAYISVGA